MIKTQVIPSVMGVFVASGTIYDKETIHWYVVRLPTSGEFFDQSCWTFSFRNDEDSKFESDVLCDFEVVQETLLGVDDFDDSLWDDEMEEWLKPVLEVAIQHLKNLGLYDTIHAELQEMM